MKKFLITTFIMIIFIFSLSVVLAKTATVNTQGLNLRDGSSTVDTNIIRKLDKGVTVNVLEDLDGWYKISYENDTGYVAEQYLDINPETNEGTTGVTTGETTIGEGQEKLLSDAEVYALPLINSTKVANLSANSVVIVVSKAGKWLYVQTDEVSGWIFANKIEKTLEGNNETNNSTENNETANNQINQVENQVSSGENNVTQNTVVQENPQVNEQDEEYPKTMYVNVDAVNVREKATTDSDVLTSIEFNNSVKVIGESEDWYNVEISNTKGYVKKEYLSNNKN